MLTILNELVEITNLKDEIDWNLMTKVNKFYNQTMVGYTFFAPSNTAFGKYCMFLSKNNRFVKI